MNKGNRLCFYLNIGDEDGPSFSYTINNKTKVGKTGLKITYNSDKNDYWSDNIYLVDDKLSNIIKKYDIIDFMEIHDWYDFIDINDAKEISSYLNKVYNNSKLPENIKIKYVLVTVNQYNEIPRKYLIPKSIYRLNTNVLKFIEKMDSYKIEASYKKILTTYDVVTHNYYLYDKINEEDDDDESDSSFTHE